MASGSSSPPTPAARRISALRGAGGGAEPRIGGKFAHKRGRLILEMIAFKDHLARLEREDGLPRIVVRRFQDDSEHTITFDEEAYSLGMSGLTSSTPRRCALPIPR